MNPIKEAVKVLADAEAVIVVAGAGMSVDSGLPDFRSPQGLWEIYPALEHLKLDFESMAVPRWFEDDPSMAWAFYGHRQALYRDTPPHEGYRMLLEMCAKAPRGFFVLTSNVDGHFLAAGFPEGRVVELHGDIQAYQCITPCTRETWLDDPKDLHIDLGELRARGPLPRCPACGGIARPNVHLLLDDAWIDDHTKAAEGRFNEWLESLDGARTAVVEIGAGTHIGDLRRRAENLAADFGGRLIRINPGDREMADPGVFIKHPALEALRRMSRRRRAIDRFRVRRERNEIRSHPRRSLFEVIEDGLGTSDDRAERRAFERTVDAFDKMAEAGPGVVLTTQPRRHLHVLKTERVYSKPWTVDIGDGKKAWVDRFHVDLTYAGMIEGLPRAQTNKGRIERAQTIAKGQLGCVRTVLVPPRIYDETSFNPVLPTLTCAVLLCSWVRLREEDDGSQLGLVFFSDGDPNMTVPEMVSEALAQVSWAQEAEGFGI